MTSQASDTLASLEGAFPGLRERRPRAVARAVTALEHGGRRARDLVRRLYPATGGARVVGITGPPGAGKSTLVDRIARLCRERNQTVGILAVDPSSPFSGGALLGDRVRMQQLYTDPGCFIRSMATRGAMGGLARATRDAVDLLDATGFDWILVETVGVGQDEVDIVRSVDTVAVVTVPGLGDEIQAIKAGLMEIADLFVLNKCDRQGVDETRRDLRSLLAMGHRSDWLPPVVETVANQNRGIEELLGEIGRHYEWLKASGEQRRRRQHQLRLRVENALKERVLEEAATFAGLDGAVERGLDRGLDPYTLSAELFESIIEAAHEAT